MQWAAVRQILRLGQTTDWLWDGVMLTRDSAAPWKMHRTRTAQDETMRFGGMRRWVHWRTGPGSLEFFALFGV